MGTAAAVAAVMAACGAGALAAQEPTSEQVAQVLELARPGPEHEALARLAGEWDLRILGWPAPGAEPFEVTGRAVNRTILGGRFLESRSTSTVGGETTESISIHGFDRRHGEYTIIGLDTFGTYWVTAQGPRAEDGRIVMRGTDDMVTLNHTQVYDMILTIDGPDRYTVEIIFHDEMHRKGGPPFKAVEIAHTRRRS
jgi:hypothetical protein